MSEIKNRYRPIEIGSQFGRLTITGEAERHHSPSRVVRQWHCLCACGTEKIISGEALKRGATKSCGCLRNEKIATVAERFNKTHGMTNASEYRCWQAMKIRCHSPASKDYPKYGAKGITVCDEWRNSFDQFFSDMGPRPSPKHSVDRIDGSLGYFKENCRWATSVQQNGNKINNVFLELDGQIKNVSAWAREAGISASLLRWRLNNGWDISDAIRTPSKVARNGSSNTSVQDC